MTSGDEISAAEARLGVRLPPSYRACRTNGDNLPGEHDLRLLDLSSMYRFARREPDWLEAWMEGARTVAEAPDFDGGLPNDPADPATMPLEQLADTIVISTTDDMRMLLLNPSVTDAAGEWEAWDFATWYPGAYRYRSFAHLVEALERKG